jgi:hypothetical protein
MWRPLCWLTVRCSALGSEDGWELLAAHIDPDAALQPALDELEASMVAISRGWVSGGGAAARGVDSRGTLFAR